MSRGKKKDPADFEASIKKLEEIVRRLEEEQVPLEESLVLFAEGKRLARLCESGLTEAENRVRQIIEDAEGNLREAPLAPAGDVDENAGIPGANDPNASGVRSAKKDDLPF